jgi:SAM-dependent methyltransferase
MGDENPTSVYDRTGREHRELIESMLPDDWSWSGRRVLDFGCGVGRVLRQFAPEAEEGEFWGCDLDRSSIAWLRENLSPPFHVFDSNEAPGLPQKDGYFDLIYAFSVYTHLTDHWAGWLLEHHRALADNGLLFVTFLGEGMAEALIDEKWDEDRIGMNTLLHGNPWDIGGPIALNSPWWIRAHWGRAFDILDLWPQIDGDTWVRHGVVLMRKRPVQLTVEDLERLEPDEPREIVALQHHVGQLRDETLRIRAAYEAQAEQLDKQAERLDRQSDLARAITEIRTSASWRLTAPLRAAKRILRRHKT